MPEVFGNFIYMSDKGLRFYVNNSINPQNVRQFQQYIQQLLMEDPDKLYIGQLERNAEDKNCTNSCLGLLTILHDYQTQAAWKFDTVQQDPEIIMVATMVRLLTNISLERSLSMEIHGEDYSIIYDPTTATLTCQGLLRLYGVEGYASLRSCSTK